MKRFSQEFAIDPKVRGPGGHAYAPFYPDDFLLPLLEEAEIPPDQYTKARSKILNAAFMYENQVFNVRYRQETPVQEHKLHVDIAKKADKLVKAYEKLHEFLAMRMIHLAGQKDPSIPDEVHLPSIESIAQLGRIASLAALHEKVTLTHFAPSSAYLIWVMNIADIFEDSRYPVSVGSFHIADDKSPSLEILHRLLAQIDPEVSMSQISEAVKLYLKKSGTGRIRKKINKKH